MRLKKITIAGFRGFNMKQSITLNNDVVFVYGLNGTGKSGIAEAIEWLFFNEISRKTRSMCKSEYAGKYLENIHYGGEEPSNVELEIELKGEKHVLRKEYVSVTKSKKYVNGIEVDDFGTIGVNLDEVHKPILAQSEIKRFVDTEQKDRWIEINKILGLEMYNRFREYLLELKNKKEKEPTAISLKNLIENISYDTAKIKELEQVSSLFSTRPFKIEDFKEKILEILKKSYGHLCSDTEKSKKHLEEKQSLIIKSDTKAKELQGIDLSLKEESLEKIGKIKNSTTEILNLLGGLKEVDLKEAKFLEDGLGLVKDHVCPFCSEKTLTPEKKKHLQECVFRNKEHLERQKRTEEKVKELTSEKEAFFKELYQCVPGEKILNVTLENLSEDKDYEKEAQSLSEFITRNLKNVKEEIGKKALQFEGLAKIIQETFEKKRSFNEEEIKQGITDLEEELKKLRSQLSTELQTLQGIKEKIIEKTPGLSPAEKEELKKIQVLLKILENGDDIKIWGITQNNLQTVNSLIENVEAFERQKAETLLTKLSKGIEGYYNELNPNEKTKFSEIVAHGKSRKARIKGTSFGKEINPISCFSEAHTNCLGLSLYFPQRVDSNPYWNFILLDDPVQSMDDEHSKNLIRILKRISKDRQVIVLSHSRTFYQDFGDLFYGQDYLAYEFSNYTKEGPRITLLKGNIDNCLDLAELDARGTFEERSNAANNIRKAIENFTTEFLIHKCGYTISQATKKYEKLEEKMDELEKNGKIEIGDIAEIKAFLNIGDPGSHARPKRDFTTNDLLDGIELVKKLQGRYLK